FPGSSTARTSTRRRSGWSHPSSWAMGRSYPCWQLSPGRASALWAEAELVPATDRFLGLFEEPRAVGFVLVRDELSGRVLLVPFRLKLHLAGVKTRQVVLLTLCVGLCAHAGFRIPSARTADRRPPSGASVDRSPGGRARLPRKVGTNQTSASCWWLASPETPTPT